MSEAKRKRSTTPSESKHREVPAVQSVQSKATSRNIDNDELDPHTRKILKIRELMKQRDAARASGEFGKSDSIRDLLVEKYKVDIIDQKDGPSGWKFKDGSSNKITAGTKLPSKPVDEAPSSAKKRGRDDEASQPQTKKRKDEPKQTTTTTTAASSKPKAAKVATAEQERNKALVANLAGNTSEGGRRVQGVLIEDLKIGTGKVCKIGDRIKMHYIGKLKTNGKVFDSSVNKPFVFRLGRGEVIGGWEIGCQGMAIGGKRRLTIPPEKAYGRAGAPPTIPGNATLVFEVSLVDIA